MDPAAAAMLAEDLGRFALDPLGFVYWAYPWGQPGTSLADIPGPMQWEVDLLGEVGERLRRDPHEPIQMAIASGKGVTKSATCAHLIHWAMATHEDCRGIITANTEPQLRTKTWPEVMKWYYRLICRDMFEATDTTLRSRRKEHKDTWRFDRVTWSEYNLEAAQGLHNQGRRILALFDEASRIAQPMWDATAGILTDQKTQVLWFVFGNYTQNIGPFHECFTRFRHRWSPTQIDSRNVACTNKTEIAKWIEDYGEDSDKVRVWVRGLPPNRAVNQLIPIEDIDAAVARAPVSTIRDPLIFGLDCSRMGDDDNVIRKRKGRDAKFPAIHLPSSTPGPAYADRVSQEIQAHQRRGERVHAIMVDCTGGYGWSVFDSLVTLGYSPIPVNFAARATKKGFHNIRMQMYDDLRQWLAEGGAIEDNDRLREDLAAQQYTFTKQGGLQILIDKEDIKTELGRSPDDSDALAITFATAVAGDQVPAGMQGGLGVEQRRARQDYDPLASG